MHRVVLLLMAAAAFARGAPEPPIVVTLDPVKTSIEFTLTDVLHTVRGTFKLKSGRIEVDPGRKTISGKAIVDVASGDSGNRARDGRMKKNILEVDRYPEIVFEPTTVDGFAPGAPSSSVISTGWFSIHGGRHQISVPMQIDLSGRTISGTGKFTVPYVAWGMKNPSTFLLRVNESVEIVIRAIGTATGGGSDQR